MIKNDMVKEFVEELRAGYMPEPFEASREVERLNELCNKAAHVIELQMLIIETIDEIFNKWERMRNDSEEDAGTASCTRS